MYGNTTLRNAALRHIPIKVSGIYGILNTNDNKFYIGSANDIRKRLRHHLIHLRKNAHTSPHLQRAFLRDGESAFVMELLELVEPSQLYEREQLWIDRTSCYEDHIGYNICRVAGPPPVVTYTDEMRASISARFKGKPKSAEHKTKIGEANKGRVITEGQRQRISETLKDYYADPERRRVLSERQKGKPSAFKGFTHSEETKKALSLHKKEQLHDNPELLNKLRQASLKGAEASATPEARKKRSLALKGKPNLKNRKYSAADVSEWRLMRESGLSYGAISKLTGVDVCTIHRLSTKAGKIGKTEASRKKYTPDDKEKWASMLASGMSFSEVEKSTGVNRATISEYVFGRRPSPKTHTNDICNN